MVLAAVLAAGALIKLGMAGVGTPGEPSSGSAAVPLAVAPEAAVDFGDVPVVVDMSQALFKEFFIRNDGTANLVLGEPEVRTLEGC